jgi:regulatory protein
MVLGNGAANADSGSERLGARRCRRRAAYNRAMSFRRTHKTYDEAALFEYAIGALGRRMRSVAEMKRLLRQRVGGQQDGAALIEAVVARLKDLRYLNDTQYAAAYSSFRRDNEKFGRQRVVTDLKGRGVHGDVIAKAVSEAYAGVNEEKLARDYLRRKRLVKPANERQTARIFRALVRAGFSMKTALTVLKKWDVDDEVLSLLETEQD